MKFGYYAIENTHKSPCKNCNKIHEFITQGCKTFVGNYNQMKWFVSDTGIGVIVKHKYDRKKCSYFKKYFLGENPTPHLLNVYKNISKGRAYKVCRESGVK